MLPEDFITSIPELLIFQARAMIMSGDFEGAESKLEEAERSVDSSEEVKTKRESGAGQNSPYHNTEALKGRIATVRAMRSMYRGQIDDMIEYGNRALELLDQNDLMWQAVAATSLAMAYGWAGLGDVPKAEQAFVRVKTISERAGNIHYKLFATAGLIAVRGFQGRLKEARDLCLEGIKMEEDEGLKQTGMSGSFLCSLGSIYCETGELQRGFKLIERGIGIAERSHDTVLLLAHRLNLINSLFNTADYRRMDDIIRQFEKDAENFTPPPWMQHSLSAIKARIKLERGDLDAAAGWIRERGLSVDDELTFRRESEHITMVRILIAHDLLENAEKLILRLIESAEKSGRISSVIQLTILKVRLLMRWRDTAAALECLRLALSIAESGGFFQIFIREGLAMADLLHKILSMKEKATSATSNFTTDYVKKLIIAFKSFDAVTSSGAPFDTLSDRELDVLRLIEQGYSNQKIAETLFISINTVRTHTKNINTKLDVHNRTQAIARAKELGLI
jgi:LuxR family maltose regulon positive regulatory protein